MKRFKKGLNPAIQHKVGSMRFDYVFDAVESATMAESVCNRLRKYGEPVKKKNDSGNRFGNRTCNQDQRNGNKNRGGQSEQEWNDRADGNHADKRQRVDMLNGNCNNCGKFGHHKARCWAQEVEPMELGIRMIAVRVTTVLHTNNAHRIRTIRGRRIRIRTRTIRTISLLIGT